MKRRENQGNTKGITEGKYGMTRKTKKQITNNKRRRWNEEKSKGIQRKYKRTRTSKAWGHHFSAGSLFGHAQCGE